MENDATIHCSRCGTTTQAKMCKYYPTTEENGPICSAGADVSDALSRGFCTEVYSEHCLWRWETDVHILEERLARAKRERDEAREALDRLVTVAEVLIRRGEVTGPGSLKGCCSLARDVLGRREQCKHG